MTAILEKVNPLILDGSRSIREQQLKLYRTLPSEEVANHVSKVLTYVHIGMMHMAADIRSTSIDVLDWLVSIAGQEVVSSAGGWYQTLDRLIGILGWRKTTDTGNWTQSQISIAKPGADSKLRTKQMNTMVAFLETGFREPNEQGQSPGQVAARLFPLCDTDRHSIGTKTNPFGYLNLFGPTRHAENEIYDDVESRKRIFEDKLYREVVIGVQGAKKEGGDVGRVASTLDKLLNKHFGG